MNGILVDESNFYNTLMNAVELSTIVHQNKYANTYDYVVHLDDTYRVVDRLYDETNGFCTEELEMLHIAAFLHDSLEDTSLTYEDISSYFGEEVAFLVECVTDHTEDQYGNELKNRKSRHYVTYSHMESVFLHNPGYDLHIALKLADRIANARFSMQNNSSMYEMYKKEYFFFRNILMPSSTRRLVQAWRELDEIFSYSDNDIFVSTDF
jgi:(p)ppGpp synthase/HD superfamily hydrolase